MTWTFSRTDLVGPCQWWARPDVELPHCTQSAAASAGTNGHSAIERYDYIRDDEFAALWGCGVGESQGVRANIAKAVEDLATRAFGDSPVALDKREVAFAYCPATGKARELPSKDGHRDYSDVRADEIAGTLDYVAVAGKRGLVVDWKFGVQMGLPRPEESGQLLMGALCLALVYDLDDVAVAYALPDVTGEFEVRMAVVDAFDLAAFQQWVGETWAKLHDNPQPNPGPWCKEKWCPARSVCPVAVAAAGDVYSLAGPEKRLPVAFTAAAITGPEHALALHTQIGLAEKYAEEKLREAKAALREWLDANGPVEAEDGSTLAVVLHEGRETVALDESGAEVLRQALGDAADEAMVRRIDCSKSAIEAATKKVAKGKERTALERSILDDLRKLGQMRKGSEYSVVEIIKPRRAARKAAE